MAEPLLSPGGGFLHQRQRSNSAGLLQGKYDDFITGETEYDGGVRRRVRATSFHPIQRPFLSRMSAINRTMAEIQARDRRERDVEGGAGNLQQGGEPGAANPPPSWIRTNRLKLVGFAVGAFAVLLCGFLPTALPGFSGTMNVTGRHNETIEVLDHMPAQRCFGLLVLVSVYWGLEVSYISCAIPQTTPQRECPTDLVSRSLTLPPPPTPPANARPYHCIAGPAVSGLTQSVTRPQLYGQRSGPRVALPALRAQCVGQSGRFVDGQRGTCTQY